ncbi:MAG: P-loop NTPase [Spirochaetaceae bacterium]
MHVLPIASGKGGVGKSLLAANLAVALGELGERVVLADLDLGGSNLHLILGVRTPPVGIGSFLTDAAIDFNELVLQTDYDGLSFIAGDAEIPGLANIAASQKRMILSRLGKLEADYLILDLGAGTSYNTLDFFLFAPRGIVITAPNATSMVNAYLFLKNASFRLIQTSLPRKGPGDKYLQSLKKRQEGSLRIYIPQLMSHLETIDPEGHNAARDALRRFQPRLVMNMLDDPKDADKALRLRRSCQQYLDMDLEHLGIMYRDELQDVALGSGLPIVRYKPGSVLAQAVHRIADKLCRTREEDAEPLMWEQVDATYEEAEVEASADFENKMDYIEDLLHTGALTTGDLVETIKHQQYEINQLKKENALYKSKLVGAIEAGYKA